MLSFSKKDNDTIYHLPKLVESVLRVQKLSYTKALKRTTQILQILELGGKAEAIQYLTLIGKSNPECDEESMSLGTQFRLISRFLVALANRTPLIILFNEVHEIPNFSDFLFELGEHSRSVPLLMIATVASTHQNIEAIVDYTKVLPSDRSNVFQLHPLTHGEAIAFIQQLVGLDSAIASKIQDLSSGMPKVIVQIVKGWIEQGVLVATKEGYALTKNEQVHIPKTLLDVWVVKYQDICTRTILNEWHLDRAPFGTEVTTLRKTTLDLANASIDEGLMRVTKNKIHIKRC